MKSILLALPVLISLTGCASIVSDSRYPVSVDSYPSGASFEIRNEDGLSVSKGHTPSQVSLEAGSGYFDGETYKVIYTKEGYTAQTAIIDSEIDGWYWGNIAIGGLVGMLFVDPVTGAMYKLPKHVSVSLLPEENSTRALTESSESSESNSNQAVLDEIANDPSISYDEYRRRYEIINRSKQGR
nr:hypothetical protein [Pseudomonas mendocina]